MKKSLRSWKILRLLSVLLLLPLFISNCKTIDVNWEELCQLCPKPTPLPIPSMIPSPVITPLPVESPSPIPSPTSQPIPSPSPIPIPSPSPHTICYADVINDPSCKSCDELVGSNLRYGHWVTTGVPSGWARDDDSTPKIGYYNVTWQRGYPPCSYWAHYSNEAPLAGPSRQGVCEQPKPIPCPSPTPIASPDPNPCPAFVFIGAGVYHCTDSLHQTSLDSHGRPLPVEGGNCTNDSTMRYGAKGTRGVACDGEKYLCLNCQGTDKPDGIHCGQQCKYPDPNAGCGGKICDDPRGPIWSKVSGPTHCYWSEPSWQIQCTSLAKGTYITKVCPRKDWTTAEGERVPVYAECQEITFEVTQ